MVKTERASREFGKASDGAQHNTCWRGGAQVDALMLGRYVNWVTVTAAEVEV
jgi:hypothetical protein